MQIAALLISLVALALSVVALRGRRLPPAPAPPLEDGRLAEMERRLEQVEKHLEESSPQVSAGLAGLAQRLQRLERLERDPVPSAPAAVAPPRLVGPTPLEAEAQSLHNALEELQQALGPGLRGRLESVLRRVNEARQGLARDAEPYYRIQRSLLPDLLEITEDEEAARDPLLRLASLLQVDFVEPQKGDEYLPDAHELLKVERAERPELVNKVARCLSAGLRQHGTLLKKAEVSVYR